MEVIIEFPTTIIEFPTAIIELPTVKTFFGILASAFRHVKHYVIGKLHRRNHVCSKKTWTWAQARRMRSIPSEFGRSLI